MRTLRISRIAVTGAVVAACLSAPAQGPGSLVAAPAADADSAPTGAPAPVVVPDLPAAPVVEKSAETTVRRPVLGDRAPAADGEIPSVALSAYQRAATVIGAVDPDCGLNWSLLAAIGSIESDHGRYAGSVLGADGSSTPRILGPVLDGRGAVAAVPDTDGGAVDGNTRWDRAVGPMQILPSTWAAVGVDADGDGKRSADDIDDAALGAAVYLCGAAGGLDTATGMREALLRYNPSTSYADAVAALERDYRTGAAVLPGSPVDAVSVETSGPLAVVRVGQGSDPDDTTSPTDIGAATHLARPGRAGTPQHGDATDGGPVPGKPGKPGKPSKPGQPGDGTDTTTPEQPKPPTQPSPDPSPDPTTDPGPSTEPDPSTDPDPSTEPTTRQLSGTLTDCGDGAWCVDDTRIDVGGPDVLASPAAADFDADGTVETNADELAGLAGTTVTVTVLVPAGGGVATLVRIGDVAYAG